MLFFIVAFCSAKELENAAFAERKATPICRTLLNVGVYEKRLDSGYNFRQLRDSNAMNQLNVSSLPIDVSQMIGKNHTRRSIFVCDLDFERIAFRLSGCRAQDA